MRDRNYLEKNISISHILFFYYKLDIEEESLFIERGTKG